ncbi:ER degradation-enhancing alpha-mannosidase-like protein 2 [Sarcoptes scabiei]|uniref:alpha-1,2-Mannosidase n=1 Tax=Sarcoptes scabiei TaxID=52283 RepID=A0A834VBT5_SARSC|nr:ER degradation-enhancing alpha-mannosidase-like protein 2 [Sarcoptes scabiei]
MSQKKCLRLSMKFLYDRLQSRIFVIILLVLLFLVRSNHCRLQYFNKNERITYRNRINQMFYEAYDGYLKHASGYDELMPISCTGMNTWASNSLSLIDALDMLAITNNHSEFRRIAQYILDTANYDTNINISVFETNIRVVGGLLSAHLLSRRAKFNLEDGWPCEGPLLRLAEKIARKLLPAFDTPTGMPYGTVNLQYGVPENETPITCTAGVGTFIIEFGTLSRLTGDPIFEQKALNAIEGLQRFKSKIGLLGNHINVLDGKWTAIDAGIGAGVDSYFEYLVKGSILLQMPSLIKIFYDDYDLIKKYLMKSDWFIWVSMVSGTATMPIFQSLEAFFPGLLTLIGEIDQAKKSLYNYHQVWKQYGFVPEFYDIVHAKYLKRDGYPLRPEFIESVYYLYRATKDPHLLSIGADVADSIYYSARTECGYATIKSVSDHTIEDRMESFFLAETLKYLYLLFDEENFLNQPQNFGTIVQNRKLDSIENPNSMSFAQQCIIESGGYVFNTEAHPIDISTISCCQRYHHHDRKQSNRFDMNIEDDIDLYELVFGEMKRTDSKIYSKSKSSRTSKRDFISAQSNRYSLGIPLWRYENASHCFIRYGRRKGDFFKRIDYYPMCYRRSNRLEKIKTDLYANDHLELMSCSSQSFLSRLSLYGQMFS